MTRVASPRLSYPRTVDHEEYPTYHEVRAPLDKYGLNVFFPNNENSRQAPDKEAHLLNLIRLVPRSSSRGYGVVLCDPTADPWGEKPRYTPDSGPINPESLRLLSAVQAGAHLWLRGRAYALTNQRLQQEKPRVAGEGRLRFRLCSAIDDFPLEHGAVYCVSASGLAEPREQYADHVLINDRVKGVRIFTPQLDSGWLSALADAGQFSTDFVRCQYLNP